ncbi:hypothetical protein [Nocardia amamiensis]|uniref:hypothetical protein n=1 Tax=Nocardia amamiensis TaxID=404578 RepID=UPI000833E1D0|nr:hypothetical protein [Nocardia amamiensis]
MGDISDMKNELKFLAGEATAGRLMFQTDVAERCVKMCDDYILELNTLHAGADRLVNIDSFGILNSAKALAAKFYDLAIGGPGSGSYRDSVTKHIEVVKQMAEMFRKAGEAYKAADQGTQQAITSVGDQV